jgi:para-aminobenzoate synthetase/4-amino-4-deoxychorismate lyase
VFETLLVRGGRVHALDEHLARLASSVAELYGHDLPVDLPDAAAATAAALAAEYRLRISAIPSGTGLRFEIESAAVPPAAEARLVCRPVEVPGGLGPHKWRDRSRLDRLSADGSVPLLTDTDGSVLEAATANVWLLEPRGRIVTPPADGRLLPGVTRARLLNLAPSLGLVAVEEPITRERAGAAIELFLTSSIRLAGAASIEGDDPPPGDPATLTEIRAALGAVPMS